MAYFTMALKDVLDLEEDTGFGYRIGLDIYPVFDEAYRNELNRKIIDHFWNREIGQETISMFTHAMRRKMNEIMPLYNQVYESTKIQFDPLSTFDLQNLMDDTGTSNSSQTSSSTGTTDGNSTGRVTQFETPQTELSGNADYASGGSTSTSESKTNSDTDGRSTSTGSSTGNRASSTKGYQGSAADLLTKYRATLLNVDMLVIDELERGDLFMRIWNNQEEILPNRRRIGWF